MANIPVEADALSKVAALLEKQDPSAALKLAHKHLTSLLDHEAPVATRAATYNALSALFLRQSRSANQAASLLNRRINEHVPFTEEEALMAVRGLRGKSAPPLNKLLGLLPEDFSPALLAEIMRIFVRQIRPPAQEVIATIRSVLKQHDSARGGSTSGHFVMPWQLRLVVLEAHMAHNDFRRALLTLANIRDLAAQQRAQDTHWPGDDREPLCTAYTMMMGTWVRWAVKDVSRDHRTGSRVPRRLAHQLASLLSKTESPIDYKELPVPFLNAWMNAERVAGNIDMVETIWPLISHQSMADTLAGILAPTVIKPDSWWVLFKYLKMCPPDSYRAVVDRVLSDTVNSTTLNAMLAAVASTGNPELELILRVIPYTPTARTVDLVAAALVRSARHGANPDPSNTFWTDSDAGHAISEDEWDWVGRVVARTAGSMPQAGSAVQDIHFPISRNRASYRELQSADGLGGHHFEFTPRPVEDYKEIIAVLRAVLEKCISAHGRGADVSHEEELDEGLWDGEDGVEDISDALSRLAGDVDATPRQRRQPRKNRFKGLAARLEKHVATVHVKAVRAEREQGSVRRRQLAAARKKAAAAAAKQALILERLRGISAREETPDVRAKREREARVLARVRSGTPKGGQGGHK